MTTIFAMSDIHGCYEQLMDLMEQCERYNDDDKKYIFVGDYVDRGPDSFKVVDYLMKSGHICLKGNHEDMMVEGGMMWIQNGGDESARSYAESGLDVPGIKSHLDWMNDLPLIHEDEHRIYVHAGLNPYKTLTEQSVSDMLWIRGQFLNSSHDFGKLVIHGHSPTRGVEMKPNRINIDSAGVFGNFFTAAVFKEGERDPIDFLKTAGYKKAD